ncbi:hypothetical protein F4560_003238 [Saccharothrix ecbatanensis]|uniref:Uncharacterized protein n=1 Tax=Saccharothrix ecbatanensis TaxID=1105145 RepID=A0A7W9M106_9PSEU|nr:hypothetical protein [Saccharothrix ecbatanensis]
MTTSTRAMAAPLPMPMLDSRHAAGPSDLV